MRHIITLFILSLTLIFLPEPSHTKDNTNTSLFTKDKFFVKVNQELKVSEATGKISLTTGLSTLDEKISKYKVTSIRNLFRLNNGNKIIFDKYGMSRIYEVQVDMNSTIDMEAAVKEFNSDANVEFSEPNFIGRSAGVNEQKLKELFAKDFSNEVPNDEMFYRQWYLKNSGSVDPSSSGSIAKIGADIKMVEAWEIQTGSSEVIVAILDSGIKDDHPDLRNRIWFNKGEIPNNGIDDDNNGYIDDMKGWDFAYDDRRPDDGFGHGTNIATVIGANINNSIGFAGIDAKCKLMNCKNLNADNSGEYSWWSESIKYATDNGAKIINMSEGGDDYSKVLKTAIDYALDNGVMVNAAMMNKGDDRDYYPASYKGVFAVGATDTDDKRCKKFSWGGGSCWGDHISVVAPGNKIYGLDFENDLNYEVYWSGTSQSTAIVSGIASLLFAQNNLRTSEDVKRIIKSTAKDQVGDPREDKPGWDRFYGYGRVDCYAALDFENSDVIKNETDFNKDEKTETREDEQTIEDTQQDTQQNEDDKNEGTNNDKDKPSKAKTENEPAKAKGR